MVLRPRPSRWAVSIGFCKASELPGIVGNTEITRSSKLRMKLIDEDDTCKVQIFLPTPNLQKIVAFVHLLPAIDSYYTPNEFGFG